MEDIKDLVSQALEQKRVLSRLKAELRAQVFLAIDEQDQKTGGQGLASKTDNLNRAALLKSHEGNLVAGLVHEFLEWCGMEFTLKVYEPEIGPSGLLTAHRDDLADQAGLPCDSDDQPLLMVLLDSWLSGKVTSKQAISSVSQDAKDQQAAIQSSRGLPPMPSKAAPLPPPGRALSAAPPPPTPLTVPTQAPPPLSAEHSAASSSSSATSKSSSSSSSSSNSGQTYSDDVVDDEVAVADVQDDDEDYAAVVGQQGRRTSSSSHGSAKGSRRSSHTSVKSHNSSKSSKAGDTPDMQAPGTTGNPTTGPDSTIPNQSQRSAGPTFEEDEDGLTATDLSTSNLSGSVPPGKLRARSRMKSQATSGMAGMSSLQDDEMGASAHLPSNIGQRSLDMEGDRSFGVSHELAGLAPPSAAGMSAGYSDDLLQEPSSRSLSMSSKGVGRLAPVAIPSSLPKMPLPGRLASFTGPSPLVASGPSQRLNSQIILEDLMKTGLLRSGESHSLDDIPDEYSQDMQDDDLGSGSIELPDDTGPAAQRPPVPPPRRSSGEHSAVSSRASSASQQQNSFNRRRSQLSDSGESEHSTRSRGSAGSGQVAVQQETTGHSLHPRTSDSSGARVQETSQPRRADVSGGAGGVARGDIRPVRGGVYDAEVSLASQSIEVPAEDELQVHAQSSVDIGSEPSGGVLVRGPGGGYHASKGLSMDMKDTGLSASDKSGDFDDLIGPADYAETAEWS